MLQRLGPQADCKCSGPAHVSGRLRFWLWRLPQPLAQLCVAQCLWDVTSCDSGCHGRPGGVEGCHRAMPHAAVLFTGKNNQDHWPRSTSPNCWMFFLIFFNHVIITNKLQLIHGKEKLYRKLSNKYIITLKRKNGYGFIRSFISEQDVTAVDCAWAV